MKNLLIAAALSVALIVPATAKGTYVSGYGGVNVSEQFGSDQGWIKFDSGSESGYVIGATLGTAIASVPGLRIEADLNYRHNGLLPVVTICGDSEAFKGSDETWAILANAAYDIPVGDFPVKPYVLAGAGYGSRTLTGHFDGWDPTATEAGFVYQIGAGGHYAVTPGVAVSLGYIFFEAPSIGRDFGPVSIDAGGQNHAVVAGLTFALD